LEKADLLAKRGRKTPLEVLQTIASHNSYHLGQVVVLRQRLCAWPPPSGGLTWQLPAERKSHDCRLAGDASASGNAAESKSERHAIIRIAEEIMQEAHFRFYAELNVPLPLPRGGESFSHAFEGAASVKDTIEAFGVPHTEVDLILVNGKPDDFDDVRNQAET